MNRDQRRRLKKKTSDPKNRAFLTAFVQGMGDDESGYIHDGDRVTLNVDQIVGRKDFKSKQSGYQAFIKENRGRVFTARQYRSDHPGGFQSLFELEEDRTWLFWYGDLIKCRERE